jgi:hypothetical protein
MSPSKHRRAVQARFHAERGNETAPTGSHALRGTRFSPLCGGAAVHRRALQLRYHARGNEKKDYTPPPMIHTHSSGTTHRTRCNGVGNRLRILNPATINNTAPHIQMVVTAGCSFSTFGTTRPRIKPPRACTSFPISSAHFLARAISRSTKHTSNAQPSGKQDTAKCIKTDRLFIVMASLTGSHALRGNVYSPLCGDRHPHCRAVQLRSHAERGNE